MGGGIVVGVIAGFFLGRWWAEYFRAARDAANIQATRKNYRGRTTPFVVGAVLVVALFAWFGHTGF
jgi:hypothetical protein